MALAFEKILKNGFEFLVQGPVGDGVQRAVSHWKYISESDNIDSVLELTEITVYRKQVD